MEKVRFVHQGDIKFAPFEGKFEGKKEEHNGSFIVGYGEATGHTHTVTVERPQDMEIVKVGTGFVLRLKAEGTVTHQEHHKISLPKGIYHVGHEREMDWFSLVPRQVID